MFFSRRRRKKEKRKELARRLNRMERIDLSLVRNAVEDWVKGTIAMIPVAREKMKNIPESNMELGDRLFHENEFQDALIRYRMVIWMRPDYADAHYKYGRCLQAMGRLSDALACYRKALDLQPSHDRAAFMLAVHDPGSSISTTKAPLALVQEHFNRLSPFYYPAYVEEANYQGPDICQLVFEAWATEYCGAKDQAYGRFNLLDVGCGTGLIGERLHLYMRNIQGVDLSPGMVGEIPKNAEGRYQYYNEVFGREAGDYLLAQQPSSVDVVTCIGVLNYLGDVPDMFRGLAHAVRPEGIIIFTTEKRDEQDAAPIGLVPGAGRFSHKASYIRDLMKQHNLLEYRASDLNLYNHSPGQCWVWVKS